MNFLFGDFPESLTVGGAEYPIHSDFRTCLLIMQAFEDEELFDFEKQQIMLDLLYEEIPEDTEEACRQAVWFLNCGGKIDAKKSDVQRVYSFEQDAKFIYSAMWQSYQIDLGEANLHWWKFCFLFMDLKEDCLFHRMIGLRDRYNKGKLSKEELEYYNQNLEILELRQSDDAQSEAAAEEFMRLLENGG